MAELAFGQCCTQEDLVLNWTNSTYKLTAGIGTLAVAGMLSERWQRDLPFWGVLVISIVPLVIFIFFRPDELPDRVVRIAHLVASIWYFVVAVALLADLFAMPLRPRGWPVYPIFAAVGAIPCGIVLYRVILGRYGTRENTEVADDAPESDHHSGQSTRCDRSWN